VKVRRLLASGVALVVVGLVLSGLAVAYVLRPRDSEDLL
jgi:hypothetical protein